MIISRTLTVAVRRCLLAALIGLALAPSSARAQATRPTAIKHPSGGFTVAANDGFDLWFDAWGKGPGIIFLARSPDENRAYAEALSNGYRVAIYEPREIAAGVKASLDKIPDQAARKAAEAHLAGRNTSWDPSAFTDYPMDLVIGDLHRVADAAGMDKFVLAGYSGTARLAAFYAAHSKRAVGMVIGGYHILGSQDDWIGYLAGSGAAQASMPGTSEITKQLGRLGRMQVMLEHNIDGQATFGSLTGPKVIWGGSADGEPGDSLMANYFFGARIAHRVRSARAEYEKLGFKFFQLEGLGHVAAVLAADKAVPLIRQALIDAGYK